MQKRKSEQFGWVEQFDWTENEGKSLEGRQKNKNTYTHRKRRKGERKKTLLDDPVPTQMA